MAWFDWKWIGAALWESLPSSLQDSIRKWIWETVVGLVVMMAYFIYVAMQDVAHRLPGEVIVLIGFWFFIGGVTLVNQLKRRSHYSGRSGIDSGKEKPEQTVQLDPLQEKILLGLRENKWVPDSVVAQALDIGEPLASYHLNKLHELGLLELCGPGMCVDTYEQSWRVSQEGRAYLVAHRLLS